MLREESCLPLDPARRAAIILRRAVTVAAWSRSSISRRAVTASWSRSLISALNLASSASRRLPSKYEHGSIGGTSRLLPRPCGILDCRVVELGTREMNSRLPFKIKKWLSKSHGILPTQSHPRQEMYRTMSPKK